MPFSSISTILIHNHAPVLENAANIKNAGKQHFAGVLDQNRNQSYFIGVFFQTTLIVQNFSNCINRASTVNTRVRVTHYAIFGKHNSHNPQHHLICYQIYHHLIIVISTDIIYWYYYATYCNYIVTLQYIAIYIDTIYR